MERRKRSIKCVDKKCTYLVLNKDTLKKERRKVARKNSIEPIEEEATLKDVVEDLGGL